MIKEYYNQPYRRQITCRPTEATIFYPECGGQPGDRGFADNIRILDTKKASDGSSIYILENGEHLDDCKTYNFVLDWDHRYKYMVMHTAQHMLSGLLYTMFGIGTVAVHLGEDYLTIEIAQDTIEKDKIDSLVEKANLSIRENHSVFYRELSHTDAEKLALRRSIKVDGDVRIVEIEDVDRIACGGVHVSSTSEILIVCHTGQEQIRGHVRLYFKCGSDAVNMLVQTHKYVSELTSKLSCTAADLKSKFKCLSEELSESRTKEQFYAKTVALLEIKENIENDIAVFKTSTETSAFVQACESFENLALFVFDNRKWIIILKGRFSEVNFNSVREKIFPVINAKGGGRIPVFQGIGELEDKSVKELKNLFTDIVC